MLDCSCHYICAFCVIYSLSLLCIQWLQLSLVTYTSSPHKIFLYIFTSCTTQDTSWTHYTTTIPPVEFEATLNSGGCSGTNCNDTAILGDGDHGTPALNVTAVHAWNKTVRITFYFPSAVRVTGINLYFYNIPSRNIGLPYYTDVTSNPRILSFIEGNQELSQNDNLLRNVTLIPRATVDGKRFSIQFNFSNKIDWLLLTEVELCTSGIYY